MSHRPVDDTCLAESAASAASSYNLYWKSCMHCFDIGYYRILDYFKFIQVFYQCLFYLFFWFYSLDTAIREVIEFIELRNIYPIQPAYFLQEPLLFFFVIPVFLNSLQNRYDHFFSVPDNKKIHES